MPIEAPPFVRHGKRYSCERCYLEQPRWQPALEPSDAILRGLAEALAAALDAREHETGLHSKRVACHTLVLARRFSRDAGELRQVYWGALLHDLGKIGIPDAILLKPGPLTPDEWQVMRRHPEIGYGILASTPALAGEAIPLWSRLFAVIDTLDAVTSDRPYRKTGSFDAAKEQILAAARRQFDPLAVQAFLAEEAVLRGMVAVKCGVDQDQALLRGG